MNDTPRRGAGGTAGGVGTFLIGFNTIVMLVLLAGGIGLVARSLRPDAKPQ